MLKLFKKLLVVSRILSLVLSGVFFPNQIVAAQVYNYQAEFKSPVVAVIDEGINFSHPDLQGAGWANFSEINGNWVDDDQNGYVDDIAGWNFVMDSDDLTPQGGHGTKIAGIVLKAYPKARLMPLIVCGLEFGCKEEYIVKAIYYAANNGATVINLSLGSEFFSSAYNQAIMYAYKKNIAVVAASGSPAIGQQPKNLDKMPISPICNDNKQNMVLGVGSVDANGKFLGLDNYGSCVDILAVGENLNTIFDPNFSGGELYGKTSGTSFAAAAVSGFIAKLQATNQNLTNQEIYGRIASTAKNKASYKKYFGTGSLDTKAVLEYSPKKLGLALKPKTLSLNSAKGITNIRGPYVQVRGK